MEYFKLIITGISKTLLLVLFLFGNSHLQGQNNAIKMTPLKPIFNKIDLGYERFFKNNWSLTANYQYWFKDKSKKVGSFLESKETYNFINQGFRSSIELRKYFSPREKNNKRQDNFNIGISLFLGEHHVEENRSGYDEYKSTFSIFGSSSTYRSYQSSYHGEADVISKGIGIHIGYQIIFENSFFITYDLSGKRSWTNYGADKYPLIPNDPTFPKEEVFFDSQINGFNLEPSLAIGFSF